MECHRVEKTAILALFGWSIYLQHGLSLLPAYHTVRPRTFPPLTSLVFCIVILEVRGALSRLPLCGCSRMRSAAPGATAVSRSRPPTLSFQTSTLSADGHNIGTDEGMFHASRWLSGDRDGDPV
jgi:hypothetical protein